MMSIVKCQQQQQQQKKKSLKSQLKLQSLSKGKCWNFTMQKSYQLYFFSLGCKELSTLSKFQWHFGWGWLFSFQQKETTEPKQGDKNLKSLKAKSKYGMEIYGWKYVLYSANIQRKKLRYLLSTNLNS